MLTVSAVLVFAGAEVFLLWKGGLKWWHAAVCNVAALYLAASAAGPHLYGALDSATHALSQLHI